jgi:hypothetical protein
MSLLKNIQSISMLGNSLRKDIFFAPVSCRSSLLFLTFWFVIDVDSLLRMKKSTIKTIDSPRILKQKLFCLSVVLGCGSRIAENCTYFQSSTTPTGVNFINVLHPPFFVGKSLRSFFQLTFLALNYSRQFFVLKMRA